MKPICSRSHEAEKLNQGDAVVKQVASSAPRVKDVLSNREMITGSMTAPRSLEDFKPFCLAYVDEKVIENQCDRRKALCTEHNVEFPSYFKLSGKYEEVDMLLFYTRFDHIKNSINGLVIENEYSTDINPYHLNHLIKLLEVLPHLTSLSLKMCPMDCEVLINAIKALKSLKELSIKTPYLFSNNFQFVKDHSLEWPSSILDKESKQKAERLIGVVARGKDALANRKMITGSMAEPRTLEDFKPFCLAYVDEKVIENQCDRRKALCTEHNVEFSSYFKFSGKYEEVDMLLLYTRFDHIKNSINGLVIENEYSTDINPCHLNHLIKLLEVLPNLTSLSLKMCPMDCEVLIHAIKGLKNLKELSIKVPYLLSNNFHFVKSYSIELPYCILDNESVRKAEELIQYIAERSV